METSNSKTYTDTYFENISDQIWGYAELRFKETQSADLLCSELEQNGFTVTKGVANIPTAFIGEFGAGKPVIGILGEYDALPGFSQVADCTEKKALADITSGHACGHHLIGTGALEAAFRVKAYMQENGLKGTIRYYGCPAEEGGNGKVHMIRAGCFADVDACFTWHPANYNGTWNETSAVLRSDYHFDGISAHAAAAPHMGRSALDAVELMNVGANYMREHVTPDVRFHYAYTNSGGPAPNVVPSSAEIAYVMRGNELETVANLYSRINKVAQGAALMTETTVSQKVRVAYSNYIPCKALDDLLYKHIDQNIPSYDNAEIEYGNSFDSSNNLLTKDTLVDKNANLSASTDVADVSWVAPTAQVAALCSSVGTVHTWQFVAQGKSSIAYKGMHFAANVLTGSIIEVMENEEFLAEIQADWRAKIGGRTYESLLPIDSIPGEF